MSWSSLRQQGGKTAVSSCIRGSTNRWALLSSTLYCYYDLPPLSPDSPCHMEDVLVGIRRSLRYSFHCPTISSVKVRSTPPSLPTEGSQCVVMVPLLSHLTVCQNLFETIWKSFSMASPNSSQTQVFALSAARAALHFAQWFLSAPLAVPQANQAH